MTTLSSLVVARQPGSIAKVDEALARQVVEGGDLATCLLEVGALGEALLLPLLSEAFGTASAQPGALPSASPALLRLVPRAVALRYGIYPLEERQGELWVAVSEPLPSVVEDDLGFALGVHVHQYIAAWVRIREAMARDYDVALEPRLVRLLDKLEGRTVARATSFPPAAVSVPPDSLPSEAPKSQSGTLMMGNKMTLPPVHTGVPIAPMPIAPMPITAPPAQADPTFTLPGRRNTWPGMLAFAQQEIISSPPASASVESISSAPVSPRPARAFQESPKPPPAAFVMQAVLATTAQVEKKRRLRAEQTSGRALVGWARRALGNSLPSDRVRERKRGPITPGFAERDLEDAHTSEEALAAFFSFAKQYFEYAALFVVHGDLAAGHDAWGPGSSRERVRGIGVALDLPSALSDARERGSFSLVRLNRAGLDADLRKDLSRAATESVLVLPVAVRGRCVALLYGDAGGEPVSEADVGDVVAMAPLLARSLERILLRKKRASLRDATGIKSKLLDPTELGTETSRFEGFSKADEPGATVDGRGTEDTSLRDDLAQLVAKRGSWADEDLVDEGWSLPVSDDPREQETPRAVPTSSRTPLLHPAVATPTPPPPQTAVVRPISRIPIAREESDDDAGPEVTIEDRFDDEAALQLSDLEVDVLVRAQPSPDPLMSATMSVSPRPPPVSQRPLRDLPPVLIRFELVDQVIAGGERGEKALGEILELGEAAIPSVLARFPGPLTVDRRQALGDLPRPADCGPVLRIVAAMRRLALPFLAVRSADADVEVRFWATYLLGELNYADAATALFPRLFDENMAVRRIAHRSARALLAAGDEATSLRKNLERLVTYPDEPEARRLIAITAIAELKLHRSVPLLIAALSDPNDAVGHAAAAALSTMTRQDFGKDARKWGDWWESKGRKRLL